MNMILGKPTNENAKYNLGGWYNYSKVFQESMPF